MSDALYCPSLTEYKRWLTREVAIGDCPLGGSNPIRVQSMTTTDTLDIKATVGQSIRIIEAGADYVRITAPSIRHAEALEPIRKEIRAAGFTTPLIADIHFTPNAAELAARIVEKVRVNPGNYADKKKFETIEYTDAAYEAEIARIRERFTPLVRICKEYGTAMRIGTNHGSLSDRIMSRYGDTPLGMVESAMEFVRICEDEGFRDIVFSMKASNPLVMVHAYRLLVQHQIETGRNYPLHLGVTEAGEGLDGRIKSAVGIGTLLEDGLGDTIRVSLTEEPELEVPVARALVDRYEGRAGHVPIEPIARIPKDMLSYGRRETVAVGNVGGLNVPVVLAEAGHSELKPDFSPLLSPLPLPQAGLPLPQAGSHSHKPTQGGDDFTLALVPHVDSDELKTQNSKLKTVRATTSTLSLEEFTDDTVLILSTDNAHGMPALRRAIFKLMEAGTKVPVIVQRRYEFADDVTLSLSKGARAIGLPASRGERQAQTDTGPRDKLMLYSATDLGALLLDGLIDGIWIESSQATPEELLDISYGILQATRTRITRTDFISCPSCGRTLFDLQVTSAMIREKTDHLTGLKIAIMGCIVNGPGEMADADYGYVGSGPNKVSLYKGKEIVRRNVPTAQALDELVAVIKENGDWASPTASAIGGSDRKASEVPF